jgi:sugar phosphate permease
LGPNIKGTATGFGNFFANLGGLTFAYLLGAVKDATGAFESGFFTLSAACIVGLFFTIWLARIRRNITGETRHLLAEAERR